MNAPDYKQVETDERWCVVQRNPDYEVSDRGRVRRRETGHVLAQGPWGGKRYAVVTLGQMTAVPVHRLVAEAFIPHPVLQVNHKDGNRENNNWTNLEWVTGAENTAHAKRLNLGRRRGEDNRHAKLTSEQVREIKTLLKNPDVLGKSIAAEFGVNYRTISAIRNGVTWSWL